jgi:hypothetical protein
LYCSHQPARKVVVVRGFIRHQRQISNNRREEIAQVLGDIVRKLIDEEMPVGKRSVYRVGASRRRYYKAGSRLGQKRAHLNWYSQSTSIVAETIDAPEHENVPVDSRARIFDGPAIGN